MDYQEYDAVVFDLDGTLVRLAVDWDAAATAVARALTEADVAPPDSLWESLDRAASIGGTVRSSVEAVLREYELAGARQAERLPLADDLPTGVPTGVCSLNAEAACRVALADADLATHVDCVVGRDTARTYKPDPDGLLLAVDALGVAPDRTLFVGDGDRDAEAATRAGLAFRRVEEGRPV